MNLAALRLVSVGRTIHYPAIARECGIRMNYAPALMRLLQSRLMSR
jgi:hypothetical protein